MKEQEQRRQLWGRSLSKPLSNRQHEIYATGCKELVLSPEENTCSKDPFWSRYDEYILEIGFGDGEHFLDQVRTHPHIGFLGCERFINGMVKVMDAVYTHDLTNVRLFPDDIHRIMNALPDNIFSHIYVLFPDPWPKKKHNKRRLLNRDFMTQCHHLLKTHGTLCMASDIPEYHDFIVDEMRFLTDIYERKEDAMAPLTKYGRKAIREGRTSTMLVFQSSPHHNNKDNSQEGMLKP
jgi:tRNA (guanine-N7-)-methyltransferase